jgi:hypothetical protein
MRVGFGSCVWFMCVVLAHVCGFGRSSMWLKYVTYVVLIAKRCLLRDEPHVLLGIKHELEARTPHMNSKRELADLIPNP